MDSLEKLIADAEKDGATLRVVEGMLQVNTPKDSAPSWLAKVRRHRDEIVERLSSNGQPSKEPEPAPVERFQPFPTDALPEPVSGFVKAGAKAIGCDNCLLVLPLLSAVSAAIGNARRIQLKMGWTEPAILWTAVVGESGTHKTPAFDLVMRPVRDVQAAEITSHAERESEHRREALEYDRALAAWKKPGDTGPPPEKPVEPRPARFIVSDATVEALSVVLHSNWRGVLLCRDELDGWLQSFGEYKSGKGGDTSHWLSMHSGQPMIVDRKSGEPKTMFVPRAAVSIAGGIQPATLRRALSQQHIENGLAARILFAMPERRRIVWTDDIIGPDKEARLACLFDCLRDLRPQENGDDTPEPVIVRLSPDARPAWIEFYDEQHEEIAGSEDSALRAAGTKLITAAARLALVVHCLREAADDPSLENVDAVDEQSVAAGIRMSRWFGGEARRVYGMLSECDGDRDQRQLIEWIRGKGGTVSLREVQRGPRRYRPGDAAQAALDEMAKAGIGRWETQPPSESGGRAPRVFTLTTPATGDTTPENPEVKEGSVAVATTDAPENTCDDEWGTV